MLQQCHNDNCKYRRSSFIVRRWPSVVLWSSFVDGCSFLFRRSSFVVRRSSFVVRRSSFVVRRPSSVVRRPSSVVRRPSSVVRRPSSVVHLSLFTVIIAVVIVNVVVNVIVFVVAVMVNVVIDAAYSRCVQLPLWSSVQPGQQTVSVATPGMTTDTLR